MKIVLLVLLLATCALAQFYGRGYGGRGYGGGYRGYGGYRGGYRGGYGGYRGGYGGRYRGKREAVAEPEAEASPDAEASPEPALVSYSHYGGAYGYPGYRAVGYGIRPYGGVYRGYTGYGYPYGRSYAYYG